MYVDCSRAIELESAPTGQFMRTIGCKQEDILFLITKADAQLVAKELIGRELTDCEMLTVKQLLERNMEGWYYALEDAVEKASEVSDPWYWLKRDSRGGD